MDKNLPLESLRGIAAIVVAFSHTALVSVFSENIVVKNASWMVDFFFVLSGYVIALNYVDRLKTWVDLKKFQTKRFWRLYPLHFFMLVVFLGIEILKYVFESYSGMRANNAAFSNSDGMAFLHNLFLTHSIFISRSSFNAPSWSISTEFYTYFLFGLFAILFRKYLIRSWLLMVFLCFFVLSYKLEVSTFQPLVRCIFSFFIGALTWYLSVNYIKRTPSLLTLFSLLISLAAIIYLAKTPYQHLIPFLFGLSVLLTANLNETALLKKILAHRYLVYFGTISYSIYLTHLAIWWFMNQILRFLFHIPTFVDAEGNVRMILNANDSAILTLIGIIVILCISHFTYLLIEHRYKRGLHKNDLAAIDMEGKVYAA